MTTTTNLPPARVRTRTANVHADPQGISIVAPPEAGPELAGRELARVKVVDRFKPSGWLYKLYLARPEGGFTLHAEEVTFVEAQRIIPSADKVWDLAPEKPVRRRSRVAA